MEHTQAVQQHTDRGAAHGQPATRVSLSSVPEERFSADGDPVGFDAMDCAWLQVIQSLIPLKGETRDQWTLQERREFLNWCFNEDVLTLQHGRLCPAEETVLAASLTLDADAPGAWYMPGVARGRTCNTDDRRQSKRERTC